MPKQLSFYNLGGDLPLPVHSGGKTLKQTRLLLQREAWSGTECPCCGGLVKVYRRKLNAGMARVLIQIARVSKASSDPEEWAHVTDIFGKRGAQVHRDWYVLRHWALIEQKPPGRTPKENSAGYWRPTETGKQFVNDRVTVPKYAYLFYNEPVKYSDEQVGIKEALGVRFDYRELMRQT